MIKKEAERGKSTHKNVIRMIFYECETSLFFDFNWPLGLDRMLAHEMYRLDNNYIIICEWHSNWKKQRNKPNRPTKNEMKCKHFLLFCGVLIRLQWSWSSRCCCLSSTIGRQTNSERTITRKKQFIYEILQTVAFFFPLKPSCPCPCPFLFPFTTVLSVRCQRAVEPKL